MKAIILTITLLLGLAVTHVGLAAEESSSLKLKTKEIKPNTVGDIDQEVTDAKLRAKSGSKSRWSGSLSLNYNGASLDEPLGDQRPNVAFEGNPSPVFISGNVGLRYRIDTNRSVYLATGLSMPLAGNNENNFEASNPLFHYNRTFAFDGIQMSSSTMAYIYTQEYARDYGSTATIAYDLTALNQMGLSRFYGGMSISPYYSFYDKENFGQTSYGISLSPTLQYKISSSLNIFTTISPFNYNHYRADSQFEFVRSPTTQSLGAGISVARNFYLSPSLFFRPGNLKDDDMAVNLSAYINMF